MFTVTFWVQESEICIDISQASITCLNFMWHQIQLWREKTDEVFDGFEFMSKKTMKFIFNTWFTLMDITWLSKKKFKVWIKEKYNITFPAFIYAFLCMNLCKTIFSIWNYHMISLYDLLQKFLRIKLSSICIYSHHKSFNKFENDVGFHSVCRDYIG